MANALCDNDDVTPVERYDREYSGEDNVVISDDATTRKKLSPSQKS